MSGTRRSGRLGPSAATLNLPPNLQTSSRLFRLPTEIVDSVVESAASFEDEQIRGDMLRSLSLTCRLLRHSAQGKLLRRIRVRTATEVKDVTAYVKQQTAAGQITLESLIVLGVHAGVGEKDQIGCDVLARLLVLVPSLLSLDLRDPIDKKLSKPLRSALAGLNRLRRVRLCVDTCPALFDLEECLRDVLQLHQVEVPQCYDWRRAAERTIVPLFPHATTLCAADFALHEIMRRGPSPGLRYVVSTGANLAILPGSSQVRGFAVQISRTGLNLAFGGNWTSLQLVSYEFGGGDDERWSYGPSAPPTLPSSVEVFAISFYFFGHLPSEIAQEEPHRLKRIIILDSPPMRAEDWASISQSFGVSDAGEVVISELRTLDAEALLNRDELRPRRSW